MSRKWILLVLAVLGVGLLAAQDKKDRTEGAERGADRAAIDRLTREMIEAFNNRDAAAIAASWTEGGEFVRNDGEPIRGRAEVQKAYAEYFKTLNGRPKIEVQVDGLRFLAADAAVSEVTLVLKNEQGEEIASSWRNTFLVREGGRWKVAMAQEWDRDEGPGVSLAELDWLVGTWQVAAKDREVTTTYEWDENKCFIRGKYSVREGGKIIESGTQMIGMDNAAGAIHSWVFQSDGGFGDGLWTRDGKKWTVDFYGVTPEGSELTATAIYLHIDANTYSWQSVDQAIDGEPIPDTTPIKVTKQKGK
jgi:uncharacterized protein (TIGR02246 family)